MTPHMRVSRSACQPNYSNVTTNQTAQTIALHLILVPDAQISMHGSAAALKARLGFSGASTRASFAVSIWTCTACQHKQHSVNRRGARHLQYQWVNTSFSEMRPTQQPVGHHYWLPWYNNVDLDTHCGWECQRVDCHGACVHWRDRDGG